MTLDVKSGLLRIFTRNLIQMYIQWFPALQLWPQSALPNNVLSIVYIFYDVEQ